MMKRFDKFMEMGASMLYVVVSFFLIVAFIGIVAAIKRFLDNIVVPYFSENPQLLLTYVRVALVLFLSWVGIGAIWVKTKKIHRGKYEKNS